MYASLKSANFRRLYADVFWFGILAGSTMAFIAIYAARRGASSYQISLLTAGPAIINLLLSLPAGRWLEAFSLEMATFWSSVWYRLGYMLLIPLPWLVSDSLETWVIVWITILMALPGTILAISFNAMFANLVPPEDRAQVVGRRNALLAISTTGATLLSGQILDSVSFPLNYQLVFLLGAIGAVFSSVALGRLQPAQFPGARNGQPMRDFARPGLLRFADALRTPLGLRFLARRNTHPLIRWDLLQGANGLFLAVYLFFYIAQYIPIPLFPLYFVRELGLTDGQISLGTGLFYLAMLGASLLLRRASTRLGHHGVLVLGAIGYGVYPLLNGFARGPELYWLASVGGGIVWALANGGLINRLMERIPADERPAYMAWHNVVLNLGMLLGSLVGPPLTEWLGLREVLFISAGLRILAGVLMIWGG